MAYGDRNKSIDEGESSERCFAFVMGNRGWEITSATKQDQFNHIDFFLEKEGISISVDVKSKKRMSAHDEDYLSGWVWVEFAGHAGLKGWLYGGATHIAFHLEEGFLVVSRGSLVQFCEDKINLDAPSWEWATESKNAKYRLYRRWSANEGRSLEKSALINVVDLKEVVKHKVIHFEP